jgi:hypothetical protein
LFIGPKVRSEIVAIANTILTTRELTLFPSWITSAPEGRGVVSFVTRVVQLDNPSTLGWWSASRADCRVLVER